VDGEIIYIPDLLNNLVLILPSVNFRGLCRKMLFSCNGHVAKPMDQPAFQHRIDPGSYK
jgi:hypothetical protein